MALFSFGISYKTAPVSIREKVAFSTEQIVESVIQLKEIYSVTEAVVVSTCNRTEVYLNAPQYSKHTAIEWLSEVHGIEQASLAEHVYFYQDDNAINHLMRVACGLDSMVLGEPQILGQLKQSYAIAEQHNFVGGILSRLFQSAFAIAKDVRTNTEIGEAAVSVAFAAVSLSKHIFDDLSKVNVLLVGAGETIELVARHIAEAGANKITVANRSQQRAESLAQAFNANTATLSQIPELLVNADIVVSSTASTLPLIGKGMVESAMHQRRNQPMFMVDIAVPRDIETQVNDVDNVYLYTVDDLQGIVQKNQQKRVKAAEKAEQMIVADVAKFNQWLASRQSVDYVRSYRSQADDIKKLLLNRALNQLSQGVDADKVVTELASKLTNQLVHPPTVALRQAATAEDKSNIEFLAEHLGIESE
ncbi:shikimate/quinate 5-dehydrogenase [Catenovulum agarivorans DS-2]|uniref:Glutamyl-tRNA reductase n=1 Tax=Catenovulum agarivorans DS-2 TaxID=1328313 RepID=W7QH06_9ALTE|nr:glutamyl-tRNA reductase [Catenovulum agarivorans]EWH12229.1 shikimate/quinate 5-dehydrogenase [Catenovulum agarivorans DS-2]